MRRARYAALPLALLLLSACGGEDTTSARSSSTSDGPVVVAVAEDDGRDAVRAEARVGQLVQLDLGTCGGCGYSWTVDTAPDAAVAVEETVSEPTSEPTAGTAPSGPPVVGAPTTTRLAFRGTGPGETAVSVGYHPPGGGAAERTVVLTITVR